MNKYKFIILILIFLTFITGCKNKNQKKAINVYKNTSISEKGLSSYRAKVSISSKKVNLNYIVLNNDNRDYTVTVMSDGGSTSFTIKNGKKEKNDVVSVEDDEELDDDYDYTNTDLFLEGLNNASDDVKTSTEKIGDKKYTKYDFSVSKDTMNKIIESFGIKVKKSGSGYAYVDSDNHVYMINYNVDNVILTVSYTRIDEAK